MKSYTPIRFFIIIFVAIVVGITAHFAKRDFSGEKEILLEQMPQFSEQAFEQNVVVSPTTIYAKSPRAILVHFWATWCAPCEVEFPALQKFVDKFSERQDVVFVLVSVNDDLKKAKKFLQRFSFPSNVVLIQDQDGSMMKLFGTAKLPETYLFDGNGRTFNKYVGPQEWGNAYFESQIETLLKK